MSSFLQQTSAIVSTMLPDLRVADNRHHTAIATIKLMSSTGSLIVNTNILINDHFIGKSVTTHSGHYFYSSKSTHYSSPGVLHC